MFWYWHERHEKQNQAREEEKKELCSQVHMLKEHCASLSQQVCDLTSQLASTQQHAHQELHAAHAAAAAQKRGGEQELQRSKDVSGCS
jgi:hypothetical protein